MIDRWIKTIFYLITVAVQNQIGLNHSYHM